MGFLKNSPLGEFTKVRGDDDWIGLCECVDLTGCVALAEASKSIAIILLRSIDLTNWSDLKQPAPQRNGHGMRAIISAQRLWCKSGERK